MTDKFQEIKNLKKREEALAGSAYSSEVQTYTIPIEQKELIEMKDEFLSLSKEISTLKQKKKQMMLEMEAEIKPKAKKSKEVLEELKTEQRSYTERVYCFDDQQRGFMKIYNKEGVFIGERRLYPSERQSSVVTESLKRNWGTP